MAISRKSFFPWYSRVMAVIPWPVSAALIAIHLLALPLSHLKKFLAAFALIPRDVFDGRVWEIWTGQLVQPTTPMMTALIAVTIGLFGRELEERFGSVRFLLMYLLFCAVTGILWIALQYAADAFDLFAGLATPLTGSPAVTAIVICLLGISPWSHLKIIRYAVPIWAASLSYLIALFALIFFTEPWPIVLPAQLIAISVGLVSSWLIGRATRSSTSFDAPPALITSSAPTASSHSATHLTQLSDEELDRRLDSVLRKMKGRGRESLSIDDQSILDEASRRRRPS